MALVVARQRVDIICLFYWILVFALVQISSQARVLHKNSVYQRLLLLHLGSLSCMHRVCGWFKISALVAIVTEVVGGEHDTWRLSFLLLSLVYSSLLSCFSWYHVCWGAYLHCIPSAEGYFWKDPEIRDRKKLMIRPLSVTLGSIHYYLLISLFYLFHYYLLSFRCHFKPCRAGKLQQCFFYLPGSMKAGEKAAG